MSAWVRDYRVFHNSGGVEVIAASSGLADEIDGAALDYEAIGSQAGIQRNKACAFLEWSVTSGRPTAEKLGYVTLPPSVVEKVQAVLR
jgi:hypothetical protein